MAPYIITQIRRQAILIFFILYSSSAGFHFLIRLLSRKNPPVAVNMPKINNPLNLRAGAVLFSIPLISKITAVITIRQTIL